MIFSSSSLKLGPKQIGQGPDLHMFQHNLSRISPLYILSFAFSRTIPMNRPIYRRNLLSSHKSRESLRPKGYKFLAKLPAAGPETFKILQDIKNSHCLKSVHFFEFDP